MSDDLMRWLGEQLDEDERIARGADDSLGKMNLDWVYQAEDELGGKVVSARGADLIYDVPAGIGGHVSEHDPRRVLREIDADRELLAEYGRLLDAYAAHQREAARLAEAGKDADVIQLAALRREADYLPAMLHVMERWAKRKAAVYADRPGYREQWRP
jgi:hypothetical protein